MLKVAITGSTGLVGSTIIRLLNNEVEFIPFTSNDFDITDRNHVYNVLSHVDYDIFLHLAAYTNVDGAENEKDIAHKINVDGTKHVLESTLDKKSKFIYVSTGFIFDGTTPPYYEDSKPNPIGYYGQSKYEGEQVVGHNGMIVRIEYPYGRPTAKKNDFATTIKLLLEQKKNLQMVSDSLMTPTYIDDIAFALKYLFNNFSNEVFHLVGSNSLSPYDAGKEIAHRFRLDSSLIGPTSYEKYFAGKARRPQWAEVKSKKNDFYKMKSFEEGLSEM